ncbi:transcription elongation factor GreB [Roseomonas sp. NAR14]|uniref:Transcription elongation factor GreB n=1 Tax=Roseomonas acroporae TaxID=2937791 RepID=A0A9X1Y8S8_9PROT|nr:transcription elongation factor GreB [Roseomonas acroporae]MCK8785170.1 transcription elongation factor GreB [Roseomonas acroporae]
MPDPDDDDDEEGAAPLPAGTPNYITPDGLARLQAELRALWSQERPKVVELVAWAASLGDRSENADYQYGKKRLREIDRRVRFLRKRLERAQVVDPAAQRSRDRVYFGATVTYETGAGVERTVTIVGADETDMERGRISWLSPVARALLRASEGDVVELRTPQGREALEVVTIAYPAGR